MIIDFTAHARQKLTIRRIRREDLTRAVQEPEQLFEDIEHAAKVAIRPVNETVLVVVYVLVEDGVKVITAYHTRKFERLISAKVQRGVWRKIK